MQTLQIRLPGALLARAAALVPRVAEMPEASAVGTVTRAAVLRLALAEGLAALEARLGGDADDDDRHKDAD